MTRTIKIGTRGSKLALWQAEYTRDRLAEQGVDAELVIIKTQGDRIQHLSLDKLEGKGFFTKELEEALLDGRTDLAVHSMKDLPTTQPDGLVLAGVSERANPADWLLVRREVEVTKLELGLPEGAKVATSSNRRKAITLDFRPDLQMVDVRGNVPTRLNKLREGRFDAMLMAAAGPMRLGLDLDEEFRVIKFHPREFVPAPAQGVLAWQVRESDTELRKMLLKLHNQEVSERTNVERGLLGLLDGGCHLPLGAFCEKDTDGNFHLWAAMAERWNSPLKRIQLSSSTHFGLAEQALQALKSKA